LRAKLLGFFAELASGVLGWIAGVIGGSGLVLGRGVITNLGRIRPDVLA
jgi:hypothetical protein